jgi:hypothetical protein
MYPAPGSALRFHAFFTEDGLGKSGLTVTVDVYGPGGTLVATDQPAAEVGGGFYDYTLAAESVVDPGDYRGVFKTTSTAVDQRHLPSFWPVAAPDKSGYALSASGLDTVLVEVGINARQALASVLAVSAGESFGAGTGTTGFRAPTDAKPTRVTATTPGGGNRTSVLLTPPE